MILGPGVNIKRSPLCGRNFEYFSEDPYLTGEIAKAHIQGVQSQGIGTSLKHYAVNNQEHRRMTIDAIVDERALREIYLPGYEIAVKEAQPWTVMGAYNLVNGTYACEHPELLGKILKDEWKHDGLVVTDWGAINDPVAGLKAGLELEMPGVNNGNEVKIKEAVENGDLEEDVLDRAVFRILKIIFKAAQGLAGDFCYDQEAHHALARKSASEGVVLLKNQNKTLPLEKGMKIALIGEMAGELGFLEGRPHSASLRAVGNCIAICLTREDFETFIEEDPELMYKVMRAIIRTVHGILCDMNKSHVEMNNYIYKQHGRY